MYVIVYLSFLGVFFFQYFCYFDEFSSQQHFFKHFHPNISDISRNFHKIQPPNFDPCVCFGLVPWSKICKSLRILPSLGFPRTIWPNLIAMTSPIPTHDVQSSKQCSPRSAPSRPTKVPWDPTKPPFFPSLYRVQTSWKWKLSLSSLLSASLGATKRSVLGFLSIKTTPQIGL